MIILITTMEKNPITQRMELIVSHGIDERTDKVIILPNEHPRDLGGVWDDALGWRLDIPDQSPVEANIATPPAEPEPYADPDELFGFR